MAITCTCNERHHRFAVFSAKWEEGETHWLTLILKTQTAATDYANSFAVHSMPFIVNHFCGICRSKEGKGE